MRKKRCFYYLVINFAILLITSTNAFATESDPFADKRITCREMRVYPQQIFSGNIELSTGVGARIEVDYQCKESLLSLSFLKHLDKLTETIRGDFYAGLLSCPGTEVYVSWRDYHFDFLRAGFIPEMLLKKQYQIRVRQTSYFEFWAYQSPANFRLYQAFYTEYKKALPLLTRYYQKRFDFSHKKAHLIASEALTFFISRAAGAPPSSGYDVNHKIIELEYNVSKLIPLFYTKKINMEAFNTILKTSSPAEIDQALKAALLNHQSKKIIALLVEQLKPIDNGDESALFFALHNKKYIQLLLNKGAAIDYANGFGKTALFYAIENNTHGIVKYLLQKGANPNHPYKSKVELKKEDVFECKYQIEHTKRTPLMHAAHHSDINMMKLLLKYGARLNDVDELGFNALDYAIVFKQPKNAHFLRSKGLKPYNRTS
jgi:uncharacterized protein